MKKNQIQIIFLMGILLVLTIVLHNSALPPGGHVPEGYLSPSPMRLSGSLGTGAPNEPASNVNAPPLDGAPHQDGAAPQGTNSSVDQATINSIPTDAQVAQTVAQQNKHTDALTDILTTHQTLAREVRLEAETRKYQTVNYPTIPSPNTDPMPADMALKIKTGQLVHH